MGLIYSFFIAVFTGLVNIAALFDGKAKLWVRGRRGWKKNLKDKIGSGERRIWVHCASLGEFEQGRPVLERIKKEDSSVKIVLTFFSPSGYEIRKDYPLADYIFYLPADTMGNAEYFISEVNPAYVIFVKYEFWYNYITTLKKKGIPVYLISAIFRPDQHFFRWYGGFFRKILEQFSHIFVQDKNSVELLESIGIKNSTIAGDTRLDRVNEIVSSARTLPVIEKFRDGEILFLAGSSWRQDEEIIAAYINGNPNRMKWVFAPHEPDEQNVGRLEKLLMVKTVRYSQFNENSADARVLIIDNIGILNSAYQYAYIAAIGGGFGNGIHNILEPASWEIPVMFGPNHKKFREAIDLINENGARCYDSLKSFKEILDKWLTDDGFYLISAKAAGNYIKNNIGATDQIMQKLR
jgi:3-deoxy-D-manno-octulosonic-acid transferase